MKYLIRLQDDLIKTHLNTVFLFPEPFKRLPLYDLFPESYIKLPVNNVIYKYFDTEYSKHYKKFNQELSNYIIFDGSIYQTILYARMICRKYNNDYDIQREQEMIWDNIDDVFKQKRYKKLCILTKLIEWVNCYVGSYLLKGCLQLHPRFMKILAPIIVNSTNVHTNKLIMTIEGVPDSYYLHFNSIDSTEVIDILSNINFESLKIFQQHYHKKFHTKKK